MIKIPFLQDENHMITNKGTKGGICNRSACSQGPATWFNQSTRQYYCRACALWINEANAKDAMALYGTDKLCVEERSA